MGRRALSDSFLIWREGTCSIAAAGAAELSFPLDVVSLVLTLFAGGDTGGEVAEELVVIVLKRTFGSGVGGVQVGQSRRGLDCCCRADWPIGGSAAI